MDEAIIRIGAPGGNGYPVELLRRTDGLPVSTGHTGILAFTQLEIDGFKQLLPGNTPRAALQGEGERLYGKLHEALGPALADLLDGDPVQVCIELATGDLYPVPWELLVWPKPNIVGTDPTLVSRAHHLSRVYKPDWTAAPASPQGPLRVLLVIGAVNDPDVEAEEEEREIRERLHPAQRTVDLDSVTPATQQELYARIKDFVPHVLHFIGHGDSAPPLLRMTGWTWTTASIAADVGRFNLDDWKPALVFLNACRSGSAAGQSGPVAGSFLQSGALATIAMQGNIKGKAAGTLAGVFYEKLGAGIAINQALSMARSVVAQTPGQGDREAAYPALTTRRAPAAILPMFREMDDDYRRRVPLCTLLPKLKVFVNQVDPRRDACRNFWPIRPVDVSQRFVILRGDTGFGKSALSAWILDLKLRMNYRVRYVRIASERDAEGVDYLNALKLIWGLDLRHPNSPLTDPLPPPAAELVKALAEPRDVAALCAMFRKELATASEERPLTIVIDELRQSMDFGSFWRLWEHLFGPIARGEVRNVGLVLVLGEDDYAEYRIDGELESRPELKVPKKEIRLKPLPPKEFAERFGEYLYYRDEKFRAQNVQEAIEGTKKAIAGGAGPPLSIARLEERALKLAQLIDLDIGPVG